MSITLAELENDTYGLLNEAYGSAMGEVESGVDNTPLTTGLAKIGEYLDLGRDFLCTYLPFVSGMALWAAMPTGTSIITLHDDLLLGSVGNGAPDGSIIKEVEDVQLDGVSLTFCSSEAIAIQHRDYLSPQNTGATLWFPHGQGFRLYSATEAGHDLTVFGFVSPPSILAGPMTIDWATRDKARLLCLYAASMVARDSFDEPDVAGRIPGYIAEFDSRTAAMWDAIPVARRKASYPLLPGLMGGEIRNVWKQ